MADDDDLYDDLYAPDAADQQPAAGDPSSDNRDDFGLDDEAVGSGNREATAAATQAGTSAAAMPDSKTSAAEGSSSTGITGGSSSSVAGSFIPPSSSSSSAQQRSSFIPAPQSKAGGSSFIPQQSTTQSQQQQQQQQQQYQPQQQAGSGLPASLQQRPNHLPQPLGLGAGNAAHQHSANGGAGGGGGNEDGQKMFVGGLSWDTTEDSLRQYFSQFGKVLDCNIMKDPNTGTSRGFGFLKFEDAKAVNGVMVREHWLDGKIIDPKRAIPRDSSSKSSKIFVGGIPPITTSESFRRCFTQFGPILDHNLMMDKETQKPRGFGFVTFESEDSGRRALEMDGQVILDGKNVDIRRATSKNAPGSNNNQDSGASSNNNRRNNQSDQSATSDFSVAQTGMQGGGFNPMMAASGAGGMDVNAMSNLFAQNGWGTGHWNPAMMQQMLMTAAAQGGGAAGGGNQWNPMMMGMGGMGMGGMGMGMGMNPMMGGYGGMGGMDNSQWMGGGGQGYGGGAAGGGYGQQQQRGAGNYGGMNRGGSAGAMGQGAAQQGYQRNTTSRATPTGPSGQGLPARSGLPLRPSPAAGGSAGARSPAGASAAGDGARGRDVSGSSSAAADPWKRERSPSRRAAGGGGGGAYEDRPVR